MNQNRAFLLFAWVALAILLAFEWTRFTATPPAAPPAPPPTATVESSDAGLPTAADLPQASAAPVAGAVAVSDGLPTLADAPAPALAPASLRSAAGRELELLTDVLRLRIDSRGGALVFAELLTYPVDQEDRSKGNVILLDREATRFEVAQSGWLAASPAPGGDALWTFEQEASRLVLAEGQDRLEVPLVWRDEASGLVARKIYTLERGSYAISVRHELENAGTAAFSGSLFHQILKRPPPPPAKSSMFTNPESFSFVGAAWYTATDHFEKRKFEDFAGKGPLDKATTGGWFAMLRHHFLSAWVPPKDKAHTLSLHTVEGNRFAIRSVGQPLMVAPGERVAIDSILWVGPKLQAPMKAIDPTLPLSLDYGIFSFLAQPLFWVLNWLHGLFGNWGWAIIGIVVLLKLVLYPVSAKQYQSMARMRAVAPRIEQLKERYGEDRMKFNQAMMELYQKEKINPLGGCLPMLVPIPIFLALYWVLLESVELRQAPWILWIDNLTAPDPYFILPALNLAVMWLTQKLTPSPGMDPMQKKMLQWMPVVFGVLFAFFPSGLVLYWFTNGLLGLAQQWWMTKRYGETPALPAKAK